jgi:hypothetical protein
MDYWLGVTMLRMVVSVAIDGSNVCFVEGSNPKRFELDRLERLRSQVLGMATGIDLIVRIFVDATLPGSLSAQENERLDRMRERDEVQKTPAKQAADTFLLDWADRNHAIVISNDLFREYWKRYPWLQSHKPTRRVSGTYDSRERIWSLFGQSKRGVPPPSLASLIRALASSQQVRRQPTVPRQLAPSASPGDSQRPPAAPKATATDGRRPPVAPDAISSEQGQKTPMLAAAPKEGSTGQPIDADIKEAIASFRLDPGAPPGGEVGKPSGEQPPSHERSGSRAPTPIPGSHSGTEQTVSSFLESRGLNWADLFRTHSGLAGHKADEVLSGEVLRKFERLFPAGPREAETGDKKGEAPERVAPPTSTRPGAVESSATPSAEGSEPRIPSAVELKLEDHRSCGRCGESVKSADRYVVHKTCLLKGVDLRDGMQRWAEKHKSDTKSTVRGCDICRKSVSAGNLVETLLHTRCFVAACNVSIGRFMSGR